MTLDVLRYDSAHVVEGLLRKLTKELLLSLDVLIRII